MKVFLFLQLLFLSVALAVEQPVVEGRTAVLKGRIAYAPADAPLKVKQAIWAANNLVGKPYKRGGGHRRANDTGYDCSGTVSYALRHAGIPGMPLTSREFRKFGNRGQGRWITVYARRGHAYAVIAGLRLDTTGRTEREGPRWHKDARPQRGFVARHPAGF